MLLPHRVNWSDFTLIQVSGECAWHMGTAELELALVGGHLRVTWYWPNENREDLKRTARLFSAGFGTAVPLEALESPQDVPAVAPAVESGQG